MEGSKILLIDMYGVIIKESRGYFVPYTLQKFDIAEHDRIKRIIKEEQCFTKAQLGELSSDEFLTYLGYTAPKKTAEDYLANYISLDEKFIDFAEKYSQIYDFCLLSNDILEWSRFLTAYHQIDKYFKYKVISSEVHMRKPDREIFSYTLSQLGCKPEECIFIDNSVHNLLAAEEMGIYTILFNRDGVTYKGSVVNNFDELERTLCLEQCAGKSVN